MFNPTPASLVKRKRAQLDLSSSVRESVLPLSFEGPLGWQLEFAAYWGTAAVAGRPFGVGGQLDLRAAVGDAFHVSFNAVAFSAGFGLRVALHGVGGDVGIAQCFQIGNFRRVNAG